MEPYYLSQRTLMEEVLPPDVFTGLGLVGTYSYESETGVA